MGKFPISFLLILLHFLSPNRSSSAYTLPTQYFINCGSDATVVSARRNFTGDVNSKNSVTITGRSSVNETKSSPETPQLYRTARIFKEKFSYEFKITNSSTYLVRFHFFSFNSSANFAVSVSGFSLLSNFTVQNSKNRPNPLLIEEFIVGSSDEKFIIQFLPGEFSFGFVNAIELFPTPGNFIPDNAPHISPRGSNGIFNGILSKALHTIQRINVGGLTLTPDNDTLWRNWVPDDSFLYMSDTAKNSEFYGDKPKYSPGVNEYFAPDLVYQTAKEMNTSHSLGSNNFNITWSVVVSRNARHFVRVHFCDFISRTLGDLVFDLYVYGNFSNEIVPYDQMSPQLAAPFFIDFVVDSDDSGLMNISIGPRLDSNKKNAFLNGLEIMEIVGESGLVLETREAKKFPILVIVGSVLGGLALISVFAAVLCLCLWCRKQKTVESLEWPPVPVHIAGSSQNRVPAGTFVSSRVGLNLGLRICFAEILLATNNFDAKMIVGKGGFGHVFRGTLRNGMKVAVKRCESGSGQGLPEFQSEITVLSKIRHRHLVSLIGYCDELSEMILVYEFMEKGTLKDHLYKSSSPPFTWRQRLEICIGAAKGLHYLHRGNSGGFIHRDVKSTNILLDEYLVAKVADFGLSIIGPPDQSHVSTCVKGTLGYLDPDYFRTQQLTEKSDVYSFGVVLLEVLCARPALDVSLPQEQVNLAEWGLFCKHNESLEQIVDPSIKEQINPNSLRKFGEIAENCLQEYGTDRPTMGDVLWDLEYTLQLQETAVRREPHEDSGSDASAMLALPNIQRFPSIGMSIEEDDMPILTEHSSNMWASEVFSQLRMDDAR